MFSIRLAEPDDRSGDRQGLRSVLLGRLLGFCAGLVLVAAIDRLVLDQALWRQVSTGVAATLPARIRAPWGG